MFRRSLRCVRPALLALALGATGAQFHAQGAVARVRFVGCRSDGQVGPLHAPRGKTKSVDVEPGLASQFAYYQAKNGVGVLGPRGWHCFSTYGSSGSSLYLSPDPMSGKELFSDRWKGFAGPAIEVSVSIGDTSGRFEVAKVIARIFPDRMDFVRDVISEGLEPASSFPSGRYPADRLFGREKNIVEFATAANSEGLGSHSRLAINSDPIEGAVILTGDEPNLVQLSMRLPAKSQWAMKAILHQLEQDAVRSASGSQ